MIAISSAMQEAFFADRLSDLVARIDAWLPREFPAWLDRPTETRRRDLRNLCNLARSSGIENELDYALFAWVFFLNGPSWAIFGENPAVKKILSDAEADPVCKLYQLHDLADPEGARQ